MRKKFVTELIWHKGFLSESLKRTDHTISKVRYKKVYSKVCIKIERVNIAKKWLEDVLWLEIENRDNSL